MLPPNREMLLLVEAPEHPSPVAMTTLPLSSSCANFAERFRPKPVFGQMPSK